MPRPLAAKGSPSPGDVLRGTETVSDRATGQQGANPPAMVDFSQRQSFADPVHAEGALAGQASDDEAEGGIPDGGLRQQETSVEEGGVAHLEEE